MQSPQIWTDNEKVSKLGQEIKEKKEILEYINNWSQVIEDGEAALELADNELISMSIEDVKMQLNLKNLNYSKCFPANMIMPMQFLQ